MRLPLAAAAAAVALCGCSTPVAKLDALDPDVLARWPLPGRYLKPAAKDEHRLVPGPGWLADIDPAAHLTFAGYRQRPGVVRFAVVTACEPEEDRLVLLLLEEGETPLDVVADERRRRELTNLVQAPAQQAASADVVELSIERAVSERLLGPPLPTPGRIFAVAANIPSHLAGDLAVDDVDELRSLISAARPRVFLKHPPTPPPDDGGLSATRFQGVIGPYDEITYPDRIALPREEDASEPSNTATSVDYEVEIGVVIGRALDWDSARDATDDELREAAAGLVLVSDTKARNPQVLLKVRDDDQLPPPDDPYAFGDDYLDSALGLWTPETCRWWSYAAGHGSYASLGP
ncbi:MAG: fumarylacetoacetate hydrolase family protein, partial [Planctomycetota bacterium]